MAAVREINILLFGEIGAGKSMLINSIANYLAHQTLEEAELNQLITLIPIKFKVTGDNYDTRVVTSGQVDHAEGQPVTKTCKAYTFHFGDNLIRIIDTPGFGDRLRSSEQDKKNISNIMSFLGQYTELHAVCIVMKPNCVRLTEFYYCLKELLGQVSSPASQNIYFVSTHSRMAYYKTGESAISLRNVLESIAKNLPNVNIPNLKRDNMFCLDNESLRYLVAVRNGIRFNQEAKQIFSTSCRKSFEENKRLINTIIGNQ